MAIAVKLRARTRAMFVDENGSLMMAMLLITVGMMFASLLVPVVVTQFHSSRFDVRRNHSLDAAQAGVDVMLGRFRDAKDSDGNGNSTLLPCTPPAKPVTGTTDPNSTQSYRVWAYYFATDPTGHIDGPGNWISSDISHQLTCTSGLPTAPAYAVVVSTGSDSAGYTGAAPTRTIEVTYAFKTNNANVAGGLIRSYQSSSPQLCLDAGSSNPVAGTIPSLRVCDGNNPQQLWAYNQNDTVSLASTYNTAANAPGMCLDASYPHTPNESIKLQKCFSAGASTKQQSEQRWSFQGTYPFTFITTDADGTESILNGPNADNANGRCWTPSSLQSSPGASLQLGPCVVNTDPKYNPRMLLVYDSPVGAGNASALVRSGGTYVNPDHYLNNYGQFGRCLDPPNGWVPNTYMIAYYCRSTPDPAALPREAQLWALPPIPAGKTSAQGTIHLISDFDPNNETPDARSSYCLTSPNRAGGYAYLSKCNGGSSQKWTVYGDTGDYAASYRIADSSPVPLCLQPDPNKFSPDVAGNVSEIAVMTCSADTWQKWNAPPNLRASQILNYHEK